MKKQLLLFVLTFLPLMANADDGGTCGENLTWAYVESTKTLTVSGTGDMNDYGFLSIPWYNYHENIESVVIEEGVTSICTYAFYDHQNMNSIALPNSLLTIGRGAFQNCSNLSSLTIPNAVTSIGMSAFYRCNSLKKINIPSSLTDVGEDAFVYCDNLEGVYISDIKSWVKIAFPGCYSNPLYLAKHLYLNDKELTSITIPEGTTSINSFVFSGGRNITSINIPNSLTSFGRGAFYACSNLTKFSIPDGVTEINDYTFSGCSSLIGIKIPEGVTTIGMYAFSGCQSMAYVNLPSSLTYIGESAFEDCGSLTNINIPSGIESIERSTFSGCIGLKNVSIPQSVTSIGAMSFYYCSSLSEIIIPDKVSSIGKSAFQRCTNITEIHLPNGINSICESVFEGCSSITKIEVPNNVSVIENRAFYGCSSLTVINLPENLESIGNSTFESCITLKELSIPNNVNSIGNRTFAECNGLKSISLPENLNVIKSELFWECGKLESITIPALTEIIYQNAFAYCNSLAQIIALPTTPPFLYDNSFSNYSVPLKVPKGCKDAYQTAQGWKNFTNISDADKFNLIYVVDNEVYKSYEIEEGTTITPEPAPTKEGYTFSGWSAIPETMPAHDVTVTGTFSINKYKLTYTVNGEEYKSYELDYGASITPETAPTKEGYTFSGWSEIPETMPAHDVMVTGTFTKGNYKLIYMVDDEVYKTISYDYGDVIIPEPVPTKEGYTFSGWSEIPETMPAHDVTVTGSFTINSYKLTYMIDDKVYKETMYEYGAIITPEPQPEGDYATFEWGDLPQTMPAHDVVVHASYTSGIIEVLMASQHNVRIYSPNGKKLNKLQKGINIVILDDGTVKKVVVK